MAEKIFPSQYTQLTPVAGTEKILAARASDGKMFWILLSDISVIETGASIRSKLGVTTLSGSNTGDQDLSNLVAKVSGKSLILDTEITRLASVTNQDISGKVDKVTGKSLILDTEITRLASVTNQDISGKQDTLVSATNIKTINGVSVLGSGDMTVSGGGGGVSLGETSTTAYRGDRGKTAYDHSQIITGNPHGTTKSDLGLGSVDNTSDSAKPVSTAQATAIALKAPIASPAFTGTVTGITATMVGLGSVNNTADSAKPVSTAQQTAIDAKVADNLTASTTVAPSKTAVNTALALKVNVAPTLGTSAALTFTADNIQGSVGTPLTGNITASTTGAVVGVTVIIVHNSGTVPTFDSKFKKLSGSGNYVISTINYIFCTYMSATNIVYSINQSA